MPQHAEERLLTVLLCGAADERHLLLREKLDIQISILRIHGRDETVGERQRIEIDVQVPDGDMVGMGQVQEARSRPQQERARSAPLKARQFYAATRVVYVAAISFGVR